MLQILISYIVLVMGLAAMGAQGTRTNRPPQMIEKNLIRDLLKTYDKRSRPVVDGKSPVFLRNTTEGIPLNITQVTVEFGLSLVQILDLDEMDQVFTTSVRSLYRWVDYHMLWDPKDYQGITFVMIPTSELWLPDIALYNYADERLEERRRCDAKVYYNGTVEWNPMAIYKSTCEIKIIYFPFDKQRCHLKFGPWTYDGYRVNITFYNNMQYMDTNHDDYGESMEWKIIGQTAVFTATKYPCCAEPYPDISFFIWMERKSSFYAIILILPCFLLSSLTLVLFWLPPETPAKMVLGMNIFVAFFLLLLLLEEETPSASKSFPMLGTYYCLNMAIITLSSFLSVIVVNFHFRGDNRKEVPNWLRKLAIHHGARILFVNVTSTKPPEKPVEQLPLRKTIPAQPGHRRQDNRYTAPIYGSQGNGGGTSGRARRQIVVTQDGDASYTKTTEDFDDVLNQCMRKRQTRTSGVGGSGCSGVEAANSDPKTVRRINMLTKDVQDIVKALRFIQRQNEARELTNRIVQEWRSVALVLDRLFFFCYVFTMILSIAFCFPKSGNDVTVGDYKEILSH